MAKATTRLTDEVGMTSYSATTATIISMAAPDATCLNEMLATIDSLTERGGPQAV